jgi:hypothetical protein
VAVSLALAKLSDRTREEIVQSAEDDPEGELRRVLKLTSDVCIQSNPKFTPEFLMEHLDFAKLRLFNQFVLSPVSELPSEGEDEGNPKTAE